MKKILIIALVVIIASCSSTDRKDEIKEEIKGKKKEIANLKKEISELEDELEADSTYSKESYHVPVRTKIMHTDTFKHLIEVNGSVEAINDAFISPEMNGQIKKVYIEEGDRVSKGQLLVSLNTSVTQKGIEELETALDLANTMFKKQKELWNQKIGSEIQFLQAKNGKESLEKKLETLKAQIAMAQIKAPFDGIVDEIYVQEGEMASPGYRVVQLVDLSKLKVNADLSEHYLSSIKKGDTVLVTFPAYEKIEYRVPISRTGNVVKLDNRTFTIEVKLQNKNSQLKPNIISIIHINDYVNDTAFVVPSIILKRAVNNEFFLFVAEKKGDEYIAKKTYVKTGKSFKDQTEIKSGLKKGQQVIVEGYNTVSTGTKIQIKK